MSDILEWALPFAEMLLQHTSLEATLVTYNKTEKESRRLGTLFNFIIKKQMLGPKARPSYQKNMQRAQTLVLADFLVFNIASVLSLKKA